jgi:hypothetical protein
MKHLIRLLPVGTTVLASTEVAATSRDFGVFLSSSSPLPLLFHSAPCQQSSPAFFWRAPCSISECQTRLSPFYSSMVHFPPSAKGAPVAEPVPIHPQTLATSKTNQ